MSEGRVGKRLWEYDCCFQLPTVYLPTYPPVFFESPTGCFQIFDSILYRLVIVTLKTRLTNQVTNLLCSYGKKGTERGVKWGKGEREGKRTGAPKHLYHITSHHISYHHVISSAFLFSFLQGLLGL